ISLNKGLVAIFLLTLGLADACGQAARSAPALVPVTVQLHWTHQAQSAGFYSADQNGYYAQEGLAVSFLEGGPAVDVIAPVVDSRAQFGVASCDGLIRARANGKTARAIAVIYRRSPIVFMALASSGILRPQDFAGKTIEVGRDGRGILDAVTGRVGMRPDQYTVAQESPDLTPLFTGKVQIRTVSMTNEVLSAESTGFKVNLIFPDDYGVHFCTDAIFISDATLTTQPDLVRRFLRATLKGWAYAVENPARVGDLIAQYNPNANVAHENAAMFASLPLILTDGQPIGWMQPDLWTGMERTLRRQGVLTTPLDVSQVYTLQFVQEIYPR
ncbi:MAG TPA: ABC transporter substrate-binding protein, partial [Aggregatilineaceae bacterium]|nr:ABC transporter substrate-binding protein [Aggregatilineaceae bacterium]